jgi:alpha-D-xyloside xylohydrolase
MLLDYPTDANAWQFDLQYMWGDNLLIAPNADASNTKTIWLPKGIWYEYDSKTRITGDQIIDVPAAPGVLPIYVKQGSIIPQRQYALSTQFIDKTSLILDVYTGTSGKTLLIEDDDVTEEYRINAAIMKTEIEYNETLSQLTIKKSRGRYRGAPSHRQYQINFFGLTSEEIKTKFGCVWLNEKVSRVAFDLINHNVESLNYSDSKAEASGTVMMTLNTKKLPMNQDVVIKTCQ